MAKLKVGILISGRGSNMAALIAAGETVREVGVIEGAPGAEADCVVEHADSLWRS